MRRRHRNGNRQALAASDKGSYSEQDKLLDLDGLDKEEDEVVPVFSASRLNIVLYSKICAVVFSKQFCVAAAPFTFEARTFHKKSQSFTAPCHCRRFTEGLHISSFAEDSIFRKHRAFPRLRSEKLLQYSFCRFADTRPILRPMLHTHFAEILNSLLICKVILLLEHGKEAFLPWFSHFGKHAFFRGVTVRIYVTSSITLFT